MFRRARSDFKTIQRLGWVGPTWRLRKFTIRLGMANLEIAKIQDEAMRLIALNGEGRAPFGKGIRGYVRARGATAKRHG